MSRRTFLANGAFGLEGAGDLFGSLSGLLGKGLLLGQARGLSEGATADVGAQHGS